MKYLILLIIQLYWVLKPKHSKPKCIFKNSCSHYVYAETLQYGFLKGLKAFHFRYKNCRSGFKIFKNPINNKIQMMLSSNQTIEKEEIAERLINQFKKQRLWQVIM